jgi:hypothetical protein
MVKFIKVTEESQLVLEAIKEIKESHPMAHLVLNEFALKYLPAEDEKA